MDATGNPQAVTAWVNQMAAFIKTVDPNHMVRAIGLPVLFPLAKPLWCCDEPMAINNEPLDHRQFGRAVLVVVVWGTQTSLPSPIKHPDSLCCCVRGCSIECNVQRTRVLRYLFMSRRR